jgi:hypothetical protein
MILIFCQGLGDTVASFKEEKMNLSIDVCTLQKKEDQCFWAIETFYDALLTKTTDVFFINIEQKIELKSIGDVCVEKFDFSDKLVASLTLNFSGNCLTTYFEGEKCSVMLGNALATIRDLSEIFTRAASSTKSAEIKQLPSSEVSTELVTFENDFSEAFHNSSDTKLTIDGKDVIAIYPSIGRIVLTTSMRQASLRMSTVQNCAHLFNRAFAQEICPLLGLEPSLNNLLTAVHKLYLGRCLLGLARSMALGYHSATADQREYARIVSLIAVPGSALYTTPIL